MGNRGTTPSWDDEYVAQHGLFGPFGLFARVRHSHVIREVAYKKARRGRIMTTIKKTGETPVRRVKK